MPKPLRFFDDHLPVGSLAAIFSILLSVLVLLPIACLAGQEFSLGGLFDRPGGHVAPADLRRQMAAKPEMRESLLRCKAEKKWGLTEIELFFAATPLQLGPKETSQFLVFPATYCPGYFGAHSIPFWVMERLPDGTYRELFGGAADAVEVLDTRSHGYLDLATKYGYDRPVSLYFNGRDYRESR